MQSVDCIGSVKDELQVNDTHAKKTNKHTNKQKKNSLLKNQILTQLSRAQNRPYVCDKHLLSNFMAVL